MTRQPDPRIHDAKQMSVRSVVQKLRIGNLHEISGELVGPCPKCGGHQKRSSDRFAIRLDNCLFNCRKCGIRGNDQIALTQEVLGVGFLEALEALCGDKPAEISPQEQKRRERIQAEQEKRDEDIAHQKRMRARQDARSIWRASLPRDPQSALGNYMKCRGIDMARLPFGFPKVMRFHPKLPYKKFINGRNHVLHNGPAMVCVIQDSSGQGMGVHRTWLDATRPKGKALIEHNGEILDSKMCRGSQKGGAIRLHTPESPVALVMGEGIETTLTAALSAPISVGGYELTAENTAFWSGINLGNMSGKMKKVKGVRYSGEPEMGDDTAFVPPRWCRVLVYLKDGDSDPKMTQAKCTSGIKRAIRMRPGLEGFIVSAGEGRDHNDILQSKGVDTDGRN